MNTHRPWLRVALTLAVLAGSILTREPAPAAEPNPASAEAQRVQPRRGSSARYQLQPGTTQAKSAVVELTLGFREDEGNQSHPAEWIWLEAKKGTGEQFRLWLLSEGYPPDRLNEAKEKVERYVLQEGDSTALEFRDKFTHRAVLPSVGGWLHLLPRAQGYSINLAEAFPPTVRYLGLQYVLESAAQTPAPAIPGHVRVVELLPEVLVGVASNTRQKDEKRRYDNSEYELVRLTEPDYRQMVDAGLNCLKVDKEQLPWVEQLDAFYWGMGGAELPYPECLYRSTYLGPTLFLDEPAVGTRDYVIRPKLAKEESFRKNISPEIVFDAFQTYFHNALMEGAPQILLNSFRARSDINLGTMQFDQANLFSWETMVSTAAYELSQDPSVPAAMVFEPPGRVGTFRTLPELDMTYGCQIPVDDPKNLTDIIYGFLRGGARLTGKSWGTSIYGAVDRADAFWYLTHAYDLGATRFFFWDNGQSACVPFGECLALSRNLMAHAHNYPERDLSQLRRAAEVAVVFPPGYNLGHVQLGKGCLWGIDELNLERTNRCGIPYRTVMRNLFTEIERCLRSGIGFDLLWDLPGLQLPGYREVIRIREDGKVEMQSKNAHKLLKQARIPARPEGTPPLLQVELSAAQGNAPLQVIARAKVTRTSAQVYYNPGADRHGVNHNDYVAWELYGPNPQDHHFLNSGGSGTQIVKPSDEVEVVTTVTLARPGVYRLRAATVDVAGRSTVVWKSVSVSN